MKGPWSAKPSNRPTVESQVGSASLRLFWVVPLTMREFLLTQSLKPRDPFGGLRPVAATCGLCYAHPEGSEGRLANRRRSSRLRRIIAAMSVGRTPRMKWAAPSRFSGASLPISQAKRVVRSERVGRRADHAIDEHAIERRTREVELPSDRGGPRAPRRGRRPAPTSA